MISFHRSYHLSCVSYNLKKQGMKLCKMVNPKSKRQWYPTYQFEADSLPTIKSLTQKKHEPNKRGQRRTAMLNKMFMKQITDLMSTGTTALDIVGRCIEISKVSVTPDLHTVNVFWVCKGDASDNETEMVLSKAAGALRHELSTLRIMGEIPYIVFVKDKQEAHIVDLNRRLAIADYGEDYTPTDIGHLLKSEFTMNTKLSPEVKAKIKQLEEEFPIFEEPLPEMTNNVFGLDHSKIMNRLLAARKRTRDAWSTLNTNPDVISYRVSLDTVPDTVAHQRKELADFLLKRQIMQKKMNKKMNDSRQDLLLADKVEGTIQSDLDEGTGIAVEEEEEEYYEEDDDESFTYYAAHRELSNHVDDRQIKL